MAKSPKSLPFFHKEGMAHGLGFFIVVGGINTLLQLYNEVLDSTGDIVIHILFWILGGLIYGVAHNRWIVTFEKKQSKKS